jgi:HPt (histidine-containing phosphotransfer) domain-containing protein
MPDSLLPRTASAGPVDLEAALTRLGGNVDLYRHIYRMFRVDGGSMVTQLDTLVATGQREDAQRVAHTLRGLGGAMGATELAAAAQRAEAAMAEAASKEDAGLLTETAQAFAQACLCIEQALPGLSVSVDGSSEASV